MDYYILSKTGDREINEDCAGAAKRDNELCFVLADGLGGHDKGEVASGLVTGKALSMFEEGAFPGGCLEEGLGRCFRVCQETLLGYQEEHDAREAMKTTMTVLLESKGTFQWGHIGDSRLYYFQGGRLIARTLDHSVPQMLAASGEIRERDIRGHEDRNRLLRVMGTLWDRPRYELSRPVPAGRGQAFLLCTDGFWEWIEEKRMLYYLRRSDSPRQWLECMELEILRRGEGRNMDNYTAIGIFVDDEAGRQPGFFRLFK